MARPALMRPADRLRARLGVLVALGALAGPAWTSRTASAEPSSPAGTESSLAAEIDVGSSGLDAEKVRAAIARELGVDVRFAGGSKESSTLLVRLGDGRRATVRFQPPNGRALERTVELPADPEPAYETVALLAGNLARDEASELLEQLRRRAAPTSPVSTEGNPSTTENPAAPRATTVPTPKREEAARKPPRPSKATPATATKAEKPRLATAPVNLSLFSPLALYADSYQRRISIELGLVYSHVGAIDGFALSLGHLHVRSELEGAALALFLNRVDGPTSGAQVSVGGNLGGDRLHGADVAVGFNDRGGVVKGAQVAVGYNNAAAIEGAQLAVGFNQNLSIDGAQLALVNSTGLGYGAQIGLVNLGSELSGAQLGLLNVGTHVRGAQIGLVNVADRVDGAAVGLVNVVGNARTRLVGWVDSSARGNIGIKYQHGFLFTLLSGGYRLNRLTEPQGKLLEPAFAIGGRSAAMSNSVRRSSSWTCSTRFDKRATRTP